MKPDESENTQSAERQGQETTTEMAANPVDQTLVAYLDGELSDTETAAVEDRLASEPELRARLQGLQASWDMLDELPRSKPDNNFLKSTMEMVVTSARKKKVKWHRWPVRILVLTAAFALASLAAFQLTRNMQTDSWRAFVADLDFLENVDMYDQIQETQFLIALNEQGIFNDSSQTEDFSYLDTPNQVRMDSLDAFQVSGIKKSHEAFALKPAQNQALLRQIHDEIFAREDRDELLATMRSYTEWLSTVQPPEERYKLSELPVADRVERVAEIRRVQAEQYFGRQGETSLPPEDVTRFFRWCSEFCDSKREVMIEKFRELRASNSDAGPQPSRPRPGQFDDIPAELIFSGLWAYDQDSALNLIEPDDIDRLQKALSEGSARTLSVQSLAGQKKLVGRWLTAAIKAKNRQYVKDATLWEFYENTMTAEERAELEGLQPAELKESIRRRYASYYPPRNDEIWRYFKLNQRRGRGDRSRPRGTGPDRKQMPRD